MEPELSLLRCSAKRRAVMLLRLRWGRSIPNASKARSEAMAGRDAPARSRARAGAGEEFP